MGTHSSITVRVDKDTRLSVYCHYDGYIEHNGVILLNSYNTLEKATELVKLGDISSLGNNLSQNEDSNKWFKNVFGKGVVKTELPHSFENRHADTTVFYGRDRGEKNVEVRVLKNNDEVSVEEFNYYFDGNKWYCDNEFLEDLVK